MKPIFCLLLGLWMLTSLTGCEPYQLRGKVIAGPASTIMVVNKNDPRLTEREGMAGARVDVTIDPKSLNRQRAGTTASDIDGSFSVPITQTGAGLLEYDAQVVVRMSGYAPAVQTMRLPGSNRRLLIMLAPGDDRFVPSYDDVVDETRRLGEPMMRQ